MYRGAWQAAVHGVTRVGHGWATFTFTKHEFLCFSALFHEENILLEACTTASLEESVVLRIVIWRNKTQMWWWEVVGTVVNWRTHAPYENAKIESSFETLSQKANVFESWIYWLLKYGFLGSSVPFSSLLCDASLRWYNRIRSQPAGNLFASHRNAQGCLKSRTRKKRQVCTAGTPTPVPTRLHPGSDS